MLGGTAGRFCIPSTAAGPFRLCAVPGFQSRTNDIVYCPPIIRQHGQNEDDSTAVVYFGGDVQDFPESMETNRDSRGYMKYNLENTAVLLRNAFPRFHIIVIRPVRMEFKTFSCFDNFVRGNNAGVPDHTPMNHALQHLERLLQNISQRLKSLPESEILSQSAASSSTTSNNDGTQEMDIDILQVQETVTVDSDGGMIFPCREERNNSVVHSSHSDNPNNSQNDMQQFNNLDSQNIHANKNPLWWRENLNLDKSKLILIGFSKGCVVLNQFIYEFHYLKTLTPDDSTMIRLLSRIKEMYWLDGGHGGQKNTWITSRSLLETLTRLGIYVHVHVTPYQVQDDRRPWIRKEEKIFTDLLRRLGAPITRHLHFDSAIANLFTHFEILQAFCQHVHMTTQQHIQQHQSLQQHQQQQQQQQQQHQQHRPTVVDNVTEEK